MRRKIVEERARAKNRKILDTVGIRVGGILSDLFGTNGMRILNDLAAGLSREEIPDSLSRHVRHRVGALHDALEGKLEDSDHFILKDQLQAFDTANERICQYDRVIHDGLAEHGHLLVTTTIPGIDHTTASAILIELGPDISVFASARQCPAWAGPGNNESAEKRHSGRVRKGNTTLRTILIECAHGAARTRNCQFHGYHKALTIRSGCKRATVTTAHKMLRIIHTMLSTGTLYEDPETNYEEIKVQRNAPRWIRMLKKYNIDPTTGPRRNRVVATGPQSYEAAAA